MIVTLTGPSCAGKSTLERMLVDRGFARVISHTTRAPRSGELNGRDYHFVSVSEFKRLRKQGHFVESAEFGGNFYGAAASEITTPLSQGRHVVMVMEPHGTEQLRKQAELRGWPVVSIFVNNPVSVIADRYIMRVLQSAQEAFAKGKVVDPTVHAKRLTAMIERERKWVEESNSGNLYDVIIKQFDEHNAELVVQFILIYIEKE